MQLVSRAGGKSERVTVDRQHGIYVVEIGGVRHEVDTRALGPWVMSLLVGGESHEVAVVRAGEGVYSVDWRGRSFEVELVDPLTHLAEISRGAAGKQGKKIVKAYMPGRVVDVRVKTGDRVEVGQAMVVLEAMKMQNEIQAERSGIVSRLFVSAGEAVEGGDPLVEID
ncbi:MAG: biotin/lipoyl-containing protein [Thermoanaerobaculia bacterium]